MGRTFDLSKIPSNDFIIIINLSSAQILGSRSLRKNYRTTLRSLWKIKVSRKW